MRRTRFHRYLAENPHDPNEAVFRLSDEYCVKMGFPPIQPTPYGKPNPSTEKELATLFENTPDQSDQERVRDAYGAFVEEVGVQYRMIPISIEAYGDEDGNPYPTSKHMLDDVIKNGRLSVYDGGEDHSLLTRRENFKFRAAHDFFGHGLGFEFGPRGEFAAFEAHAKMFSPPARHALSCETRAQQAFVHYGPHAHIPIEQRPFAPQKAVWIPAKFCTTPALQSAYREYPVFFPAPTADNPRKR